MRTLLLVTLVGAPWAVLGCGGGSGKRIDSSAGGTGGAAAGGAGGSSASSTGGALAGGTGGSSASASGGAVVAGSGGSVASGTGGSPAGGSGGSSAKGTGGSTALGTGGSRTPGSDASVGGISDAAEVGGSCPQPAAAPCGGNPVGTWTLKVDECTFSSGSYCPGLSLSVSPASNYGISYTFNANGTLSASIAGSFIGTISYPPECLGSDAGAAQACSDLSNTLQTVAQEISDAGTDNIVSASYSCAEDPNGKCVCNENVAYLPRTVTGVYTTSGTQLTIVSLSGPGLPDAGPLDGGANSSSGYCVSGNTMTLWDSSSSTSKPTLLTK